MKNKNLKSWDDGAKKYLEVASEDNDLFKSLIDIPVFISLLGDIKGKRILDIGCGNGDLINKLIKKGAIVYGLDGSRNMIEAAMQNAPKAEEYVVCDLMNEEIPFDEEYFDIVTSKMMLMNVSSLDVLAWKVKKVLKDKGLFAADFLHPFRPIYKQAISDTKSYDDNLNYFEETEGKIRFQDKEYAFYYRPTSLYINTFIQEGFQLVKMQEPFVSKEFIKKHPGESKRLEQTISMHLLFSL